MDTVSEAILSLKPVTFRYKGDQTNTAQFGLITLTASLEKVSARLALSKPAPQTVREH